MTSAILKVMRRKMENNMSDLSEKWVNLEDIAKHLSISCDTVRNWIKSGRLPFYRAGKMYKFKISEVDDWVRQGKITK